MSQSDIPVLAGIRVVSLDDYIARNIHIGNRVDYDRVLIVSNGEDVLAYLPIQKNMDKDLEMVKTLMDSIIHSRKVSREVRE